MLVVPKGTDLEAFYRMQYGPETMPEDYDERINASPLGKHVSMLEPRLYGNVTVRGTDLVLVGQDIDLPTPINPKGGFILIGSGVARQFGLRAGDELQIEEIALQVLRVIDPPPKGFDMAIFAPLYLAQRILGKTGKINALHMGGCWCEMDVPAFAARVEATLPGTMSITVEGMARAQQEIIGIMEQYSVVIWTAGVVLAVGSIVFLMLYLIQKGEREIGILLSIGLLPGQIVIKNVVVALLTALAGSVLGYVLSAPLMIWFGKAFMNMGLAPEWENLPYFLAASMVVASGVAIIPSWYITRLDPTNLLREE
jgi:ABC-type lipoprotein release transport system permease subunit